MHLVLITFFFQAHWSLVVVHVKERLIEHFDPRFHSSDCLTKIKNFLQEELQSLPIHVSSEQFFGASLCRPMIYVGGFAEAGVGVVQKDFLVCRIVLYSSRNNKKFCVSLRLCFDIFA